MTLDTLLYPLGNDCEEVLHGVSRGIPRTQLTRATGAQWMAHAGSGLVWLVILADAPADDEAGELVGASKRHVELFAADWKPPISVSRFVIDGEAAATAGGGGGGGGGG